MKCGKDQSFESIFGNRYLGVEWQEVEGDKTGKTQGREMLNTISTLRAIIESLQGVRIA